MKEFIKEAGCGMLILAVLLSFFIWLCWEDIGGLYGLLYHLLFVWYFLILLGVAGLLDAITRSRQSRMAPPHQIQTTGRFCAGQGRV
jgi:hypothetical protein